MKLLALLIIVTLMHIADHIYLYIEARLFPYHAIRDYMGFVVFLILALVFYCYAFYETYYKTSSVQYAEHDVHTF